MFQHVLAIDPSLTCSGWALFSVTSGQPIATGTLSAIKPPTPLSIRIARLHSDVADLMRDLKLNSKDILICEGPAPIKLDPLNSMKVEQVRGVFENCARNIGVLVPARVNPRSLQSEVLGLKGAQLERKEVKRIAREFVENLFADYLKRSKVQFSQDIIDAMILGVYAVTRVKYCGGDQGALHSLFNSSKNRAGRAKWSEASISKMGLKIT